MCFQSQLRSHEREQHGLPDIYSTSTSNKLIVSSEVDEREGTAYIVTWNYKKLSGKLFAVLVGLLFLRSLLGQNVLMSVPNLNASRCANLP